MKYIKTFEKKRDPWNLEDWFKSDFRDYDSSDYFTSDDLWGIINQVTSKFHISEKEAKERIENHFGVPTDPDVCLGLAAENLDMIAVVDFLESGADVDSKDEEGNTPLITITKNSKDDIKNVKLILEFDPDMTIRNNEGKDFYDVATIKVKKYIDEKYPLFGATKKYNL